MYLVMDLDMMNIVDMEKEKEKEKEKEREECGGWPREREKEWGAALAGVREEALAGIII